MSGARPSETLDEDVLSAIRLGRATQLHSLCRVLGLGTAGADRVQASLDRLTARGLIALRPRPR